MSQPVVLLLEGSGGRSRTITVGNRPLTLGSDPGSDVVLDGPAVAPLVGRIDRDDDGEPILRLSDTKVGTSREIHLHLDSAVELAGFTLSRPAGLEAEGGPGLIVPWGRRQIWSGTMVERAQRAVRAWSWNWWRHKMFGGFAQAILAVVLAFIGGVLGYVVNSVGPSALANHPLTWPIATAVLVLGLSAVALRVLWLLRQWCSILYDTSHAHLFVTGMGRRILRDGRHTRGRLERTGEDWLLQFRDAFGTSYEISLLDLPGQRVYAESGERVDVVYDPADPRDAIATTMLGINFVEAELAMTERPSRLEPDPTSEPSASASYTLRRSDQEIPRPWLERALARIAQRNPPDTRPTLERTRGILRLTDSDGELHEVVLAESGVEITAWPTGDGRGVVTLAFHGPGPRKERPATVAAGVDVREQTSITVSALLSQDQIGASVALKAVHSPVVTEAELADIWRAVRWHRQVVGRPLPSVIDPRGDVEATAQSPAEVPVVASSSPSRPS